MGIRPYKSFTFGGDSSLNYGIYVTGEGVFNAPERAVEMLTIPGRNGNFALDQGRFENIEVTYKCGIVDYSESDFADKISTARNWLCSKVGYVRLEDDYNPSEYRMAVYKSGVEVEHVDLSTGEFDVVFDCKPQRWLSSGETATAIANNGTITNPTPFDSEPLLAVKGYGALNVNGYDINLEYSVIGNVMLISDSAHGIKLNPSKTYDSNLVNTNDTLTLKGFEMQASVRWSGQTISATSASDSNANFSSTLYANHGSSVLYIISASDLTYSVGTLSAYTNTTTISVTAGGVTKTPTIGISIRYDGLNRITFTPTITEQSLSITGTLKTGDLFCDSTRSTLGNPTYIDCDIGECYMINNGVVSSLNSKIDLGSDLPKLSSGSNTVKYDNTITEVKITPRWWIV